MLTLLSAATLTASSVMALTLYYPIAAVSRMAPSEIECRIEDENEIAAIRQILSAYSSDTDVTFLQTDIYKVTSTAEQLPVEYGIGTSKGDADNERILREAGFECIPYSAYQALLEAQGRTKVPEHPLRVTRLCFRLCQTICREARTCRETRTGYTKYFP